MTTDRAACTPTACPRPAPTWSRLNLHHDLNKRGIAVVALHPGMVATDLTKNYPGNFNYIQPEEAARGLIARMDELTPASSGQFRHANGDKLLW